MLSRGRRLATTTGTDAEALKDKLVRSYFHIPDAPKASRKARRK